MERIILDAQLSLSPYYPTDSGHLVNYLNDMTVYENMLVIPYPYTPEDAFERRNLQWIEAIPFDHNVISSKVLEKVGFHCEGTLRNYCQKKGENITVKMYALFPEDLKG